MVSMTHPMPSKRLLGAKQREVLLEWIDDREGTFTIKDIEDEYEVHYQTAFNWMRTLETEGLVQVSGKGPDGKTNLYHASAPVGGYDPESMNSRALRIAWGKDKQELSIAEWVVPHHTQDYMEAIGSAFFYLFVRSYYYDAPDHQHLRGVASPIEVRAAVEKIVKFMEAELNAIRQILALRVPWVEGPSFSLRFGAQPAGFDLTKAVEMAQAFQRDVLGYKEAFKEIDEEDSP